MFEQASRIKLRFNYKGICSTEDLWDAPLAELDAIFKGLSRLKKQDEESLLDEQSKEEGILTLKIDIVKHIVSTRLRVRDLAEDEKDRAERKQALLGIIAEKQGDELRSMSIGDLTKLVDDL